MCKSAMGIIGIVRRACLSDEFLDDCFNSSPRVGEEHKDNCLSYWIYLTIA
jgi:hypothetical protein